jgi:hypothetical protein
MTDAALAPASTLVPEYTSAIRMDPPRTPKTWLDSRWPLPGESGASLAAARVSSNPSAVRWVPAALVVRESLIDQPVPGQPLADGVA